MIFIINGSNRVGKNKFVKYFIKYCNSTTFEISTVDVLKKIAKEYLGWDGKKDEKGRKFLVDLKKAWVEFNDGPFNDVVKKIDKKKAEYSFVYCREPVEIQKFKNYYGDNLVTVLMKKDDREVANNEADMNVSNYDYDYIIDNNGTKEELEEMIKIFTEMMIKKKE